MAKKSVSKAPVVDAEFDSWYAEELAKEASGLWSAGQIKAFQDGAVNVPCKAKYRR